MRFAARFLVIFLLASTFYFLSSATPTYAVAQTIPAQSNTTTPVASTNPNVPNNLHNWTQNVMIEVMSSLTCQLTGIDPINPKQPCLGADQKNGKIGFLPSVKAGGAIGVMDAMITSLYTPPLHTADYFKDLASNFGISKKAYAAQTTTGTGFDSLKPLMNIWSTFRNIVYLILVIVFVVIGLAIMLRVKIDPRTVMTIQNQIPKIIVGILAVTFSFAIAGFLIDMMWISIYLIFGLVSGASSHIATSIKDLNPILLQGKTPIGVFGNLNDLVGPVATGTKEIVRDFLGIKTGVEAYIPFFSFTPFSGVLDALKSLISGNGDIKSLINIATFPTFMTSSPANSIIDLISMASSLAMAVKVMGWDMPSFGAQAATFGVELDLGWIGNGAVALVVAPIVYTAVEGILRDALPWLIIYVIVSISLFIALFRLWFTLLMAYIQILLNVALAPFWIIGGIVPGSPISISGWLKDIGANLLAFPATIFMFLLGKVFMDAFQAAPNSFAPPLIGDIASSGTSMLSSLIGIGIVLMTPNIVSMLKQMLKAPKTDVAGGAMKGLGAGAAVPMAGIRSKAAYLTPAQAPGQQGGWSAVLRGALKF
jgi:hypothetical protein